MDTEKLVSGIESLIKQRDEIIDIKKNDFIALLNALNQQKLANSVAKKGLPLKIYVGADIHDIAHKRLSIYADVEKSNLVSGSTIILSWGDIEKTMISPFHKLPKY